MANKILMPSKAEMTKTFEGLVSEFGEETIPKPTGWRLLVMMPVLQTKTAGGIYLTDKYVEDEQVAAPIGFVVAKGPLCYADKRKFPDGVHWCRVGDMIFFRPYAGSRSVIHGYEFRTISDETVEAVVDDPRGIERI